jgi:hypothetical protein
MSMLEGLRAQYRNAPQYVNDCMLSRAFGEPVVAPVPVKGAPSCWLDYSYASQAPSFVIGKDVKMGRDSLFEIDEVQGDGLKYVGVLFFDLDAPMSKHSPAVLSVYEYQGNIVSSDGMLRTNVISIGDEFITMKPCKEVVDFLVSAPVGTRFKAVLDFQEHRFFHTDDPVLKPESRSNGFYLYHPDTISSCLL